MRCRRNVELALALVIVLSVPAAVSAQGFSEERAGREGPGFKAGRMVLHPGFSAEGGYDSNIFLQSENPEDAFILRLTGYLDVATEPPVRQRQGEMNKPEPQKIEFRGGIGASYYHYFTDRIAPNIGADAHVDFSYNPSPVFTLHVLDRFVRTVRPFTNANTPQGETTSYGRNRNTATLDLVGRSKSRVLEGRLGYTNSLEFFDSDAFNYGNSITHRVPASLNWAFFPASALVFTAAYANQQFDQERVADSPTLLSDNNRVRSSIGYNGALTERLAVSAFIGYAAGFYQLASDFDGVIARVDASWRPRPTITVIGGYDLDIRPALIGNFTRMHRLFLDTSFTLSGALLLGIRSWVSFDKSGLALTPEGTLIDPNNPFRQDIRVYAGFFAEYRFKAWLALFGEVGYLADFTDFEYVGTEPLLNPRAGYQRFDAWIGLRVFY